MQDAFLQTILERPGDDTPRLVFADWLEERDDPRGAFIRLQCQREGLTHHDAGFKELLVQETALLRQHEEEWSKPVRRLVDEVEYRRGFIEHVRVTAAKFLKNAARLFQLAPVRSIQLTRVDSLVPQLADCPYLDKIVALDLSHNGTAIGSRTLQQLLRSGFLKQLTRLNLNECELGAPSAEVLAGAANLSGLHTLELGRNSLGAAGAAALAASPHLARLRELNLYGNELLAAGATTLAAAPTFRLTHLRVGMNRIGNEGAAAIANSAACAELRRLEVRNNMIASQGVEALARSAYLCHLEHLDLDHNRITDRGLQALAVSTTLNQLISLNLEINEFGAAAAQALRSCSNFPRMRQLLLGHQIPQRK